MSDSRLRKHIAVEAAKLMYERVETEYFTAKRKAASRLGVNVKHQPQSLPSNREIRDEILALARLMEGESRLDRLGAMRLAALHLMHLLAVFEPRLIGSVATGHIRKGSDIDLHVFSDNVSAITEILEQHGLPHDVERKRVIKHNEERIFTHVHIQGEYDFELTVYPRAQRSYVFKSSITGKSIERASIADLEGLLAREHEGLRLGSEEDGGEVDRILVWGLLLPPLAGVRQNPVYHPEGDALYHSLQAFELARNEFPYDIELIAAALLHDVGKGIDRADHVAAGLEALEGTLSPREEFLIAHHMDALAYKVGSLGAKRREQIRACEWFEDLMALRDIDDRARRRGVVVCSVEEALAFISTFEAEV